jgi:hypothetical protein
MNCCRGLASQTSETQVLFKVQCLEILSGNGSLGNMTLFIFFKNVNFMIRQPHRGCIYHRI